MTPSQITGIMRASRSTKRGGSRSSRNAGRDAVDAGGTVDELCRRVRRSRVVLTPGWLASSPWEANASRGRWWQEAPIHQGERDISRKAIAQGRPECFRFTCMLVCAFPCASMHTRPRVQRAPGLPCALCLKRRGNEIERLGQNAVARMRTYIPSSSQTRGPIRRVLSFLQ